MSQPQQTVRRLVDARLYVQSVLARRRVECVHVVVTGDDVQHAVVLDRRILLGVLRRRLPEPSRWVIHACVIPPTFPVLIWLSAENRWFAMFPPVLIQSLDGVAAN